MDKPPPFTNIGRLLDPRYPTNLAIMAIGGLVFVAAIIWRIAANEPFLAAGWWALVLSGSTFFGWVLGRELDPEKVLAAFAAAALAGLGVLLLGLPNIVVLAWFVYATRILGRSTGLPPSALDSLVALGLTAWSVWLGGWIAGLAMTVVFALDSRLSSPHPPQRIYAAVALVVTLGVGLWRSAAGAPGPLTTQMVVASVLILVVFAVVILRSRTIQAVGDYTGQPLDPARVRAGQVMTALVALAYALWFGEKGFVALSPVWGAMLGLGLNRAALLAVGNRG